MNKFKVGDVVIKSSLPGKGLVYTIREVDVLGNIRLDNTHPPVFRRPEDFSSVSNSLGQTIVYCPAATGIKHDQDKVDMSLLSPIALEKIAKVMTFGKQKYAAHNWRGGFAWSRPLAAALRHILAFMGGQDKDPETGISHLAHAACCLMFLLEFEETHRNLDDRYKIEVSDVKTD